jgi:hypothetical protein
VVKFGPCGRCLTGASQDSAIWLWQLATHDPVIVVRAVSGDSAAWVDSSGDPNELNVDSLALQKTISLGGHSSMPEYVPFRRRSCGDLLSGPRNPPLALDVQSLRRGTSVVGAGKLGADQILKGTKRGAVCTHTDGIHPIPIDVFGRFVLSPIRRVKAVVSRQSRYLILHKT